MPISRSGRFTFSRQYSSWDMVQAQRQFNREKAQQYLNSNANAVSALQTAFSNQISGSASLAAQAAVNRIRAKTAEVAKSAQSLSISA